MIKKEDIDKVDKAVIDFCMEVIEHPLVYFSEWDLHFLLSDKLKKNVKELQNKYPTDYPRCKGSKNRYKTQLLHREYGVKGGGRMDICIFSKEQIAEINHWNLTKNKRDGYIKPLFGFELGSEKTRKKDHMIKDLEELEGNCSNGYIIYFFKDITIARDNTKDRRDKDKVIKQSFKDMVSRSINKRKSNKVKIIAVLISLFRKQEGNWPQCKIFDESISGWKHFENPRTSKLEIKGLLKSQLE